MGEEGEKGGLSENSYTGLYGENMCGRTVMKAEPSGLAWISPEVFGTGASVICVAFGNSLRYATIGK